MSDEKSLVFGVSEDIDNMVMALVKQKVDINIEKDYYLNIPPPPVDNADEIFGDAVISGVFVDLIESVINTILRWLRIRTRKQQPEPKLFIIVGDNILQVNIHNMNIILEVLKECSRTKINIE
ncbi:MAG: hypothetical protein WC325_03895 [Candidatus Bathyarchaeia archaeon]|jgi:hypothetical protein